MTLSLRSILRRSAFVAGALLWGTTAAYADPITFELKTCVSGDCGVWNPATDGQAIATVDAVSGDLVITLSNEFFSNGTNAPYIQELGFQYEPGMLNDLFLDSFTETSGVVGLNSLVVDTKQGSFSLAFEFDFSNKGSDGSRFDIGDAVQIVLTTSSVIDLSNFTYALTKVGSVGPTGNNSITLVDIPLADLPPPVPEPSILLLIGAGLAGLGASRFRPRKP